MFKQIKPQLIIIIAFLSFSLPVSSQTQAAKDVLQRLIPQAVNNVTFQQIVADNGYDVFEVEATGGNVIIRGSTPVAMCRALYDYLKNDCKCLVTWDGDQLNLPNPLPNTALRRIVCPYKYRHYFNVCTFGYTTVFWDWNRWQREIDWMALHGINMPLAMNGLEKINQTVFKSYGLTDADLNAFYTGPAFLPWQRMGNVYGFQSPLPQSYIDSQAILQKKILTREQELGMLPVTPGFCGFIPYAFKTKYPSVKTIAPGGWLGFQPTLIIEPRDPKFAEISKKFIDQYKQEYGTLSSHYLIDLFNEMTPQVGTSTKNQELRAIGEGVFKGLKAADPNAQWVIQGWFMYNGASFWDNNAINAFFDSVPNNRLIILDLACDEYEVWRSRTAVSNRQIIFNWLHNYGQKTPLHGKLSDAATKPISAFQSLGKTHMIGMGLTPEGLENNAVVFELMCDMMWRTTSPTVSTWLASYAAQRYGSASKQAAPIWSNINSTIYNWRDSWDGSMKYQIVGQKQASPDYADIRSLIIQMLAAAPELKDNPLFIRDLVDVSKRYFAEKSANFIVNVQNSTGTAKTEAIDKFKLFMNELDALLATIPQHRMDRWISMARSIVPQADKNFMEKNARIQVTTWVNGNAPDYARKEWSGLINQYYLGEWNLYFQGQTTAQINAWRDAWTLRTDLALPKTVDAIEQVKLLLGLTDPGIDLNLGIAVGKPVTASSWATGYEPSAITDGSTSGKYWSADPYPQSVIINLQSEARIDSIRVYPYFDGVRYYQYTISVSTDSINWITVTNFSTNTQPATSNGMLHKLSPSCNSRYIKVTMLKNSANAGVHLYEIRVFGEYLTNIEPVQLLPDINNFSIVYNARGIEITVKGKSANQINIYSVAGRLIHTVKGTGKTICRIGSNSVSPGVYIATIYIDKKIYTSRILVK